MGLAGYLVQLVGPLSKGNMEAVRACAKPLTLLLLVRGGPDGGATCDLLLGLKKRGFGAGKWNGTVYTAQGTPEVTVWLLLVWIFFIVY